MCRKGLKQRLWKDAAYWLSQDHLLKGNTVYSESVPPSSRVVKKMLHRLVYC